MAIDYVIDFTCTPKETLTTNGILERLKGRERAHTIIKLFRESDDDRPPSEMGFEFVRSTPEGQEETQIIVVQDLLDHAAELDTLEHHCIGCPANRSGQPFGCTGFIQYPISAVAEKWLLDNLPVPDDTLVWMLLRQGVKEFDYDGSSVKALREAGDVYFEDRFAAVRRLGEFSIDANQLFEMIFAVGHINPNHGALLLLFSHTFPREIEADEIMRITPAPFDAETRYPFRHQLDVENDDTTVHELKAFFHAIYTAWRLNVRLLLDV